MDVDDSSSTEATSVSSSSSGAFVLTEPQSSVLTAPLAAHLTALSPHSTLQQLHSIQRSPPAGIAHSDSSTAPLYRWTTTAPHKRQKRQQHSSTDSSSSSTSSLTAEQRTVEYVLAFHSASSISLPLLSFTVRQLRQSLLIAVVDSGQSVTVLRLQGGLVPHPTHGQSKKSKAAVAKAKAAISRPAAVLATSASSSM